MCLSEHAAITNHHILCLTTATNNEDDDTLKMLLMTLPTACSTKLPNNFDTAMYPINFSNTIIIIIRYQSTIGKRESLDDSK